MQILWFGHNVVIGGIIHSRVCVECSIRDKAREIRRKSISILFCRRLVSCRRWWWLYYYWLLCGAVSVNHSVSIHRHQNRTAASSPFFNSKWSWFEFFPGNNFGTRKHSSTMRTDCAVTRMSSDRVAMRPIVHRMTDAYENITFPCFQ